METSIYEDQASRYNIMKKRMTLDLNSNPQRPPMKRQRLAQGLQHALLTSPDVQMLKLDSPELEKLIMQTSNGMPTPTPGGTTPYFTPPAPPKQVTEAQEMFAKGFEVSLAQFHANDTVTDHPSPPSTTYTNLEPPQTQPQSVLPPVSTIAVTSSYGGAVGDPSNVYMPAAIVKEEPQTVPCIGGSPPLSPINMENQEKIKLERKRERNRVAASKCRRKKLERIARLEDKVKQMKNENQELSMMIQRLREQIYTLKQEVCEHVKCGCPIGSTM